MQDYPEIKTLIQETIQEKTNFSPDETGTVMAALLENEPKVKCSQYRRWYVLARERHETAHICTIRLKTLQPIKMEIEAHHWVYFALDGTKYPAFRVPPVIEARTGEIRMYDYRQGILAGETRKPGTWKPSTAQSEETQ